MKTKFLFMAALIVMCSMTTVFTSCEKDETSSTSYMYEVKIDENWVGYRDEATKIYNELNSAVGWNGNTYSNVFSRQDSKMKSACDEVCAKYSDIKSAYLKYYLFCTTLDNSADKKEELVATFELGRALTTPYVSYKISTNADEAYSALESKKGVIEDKVYKASLKTLKTLLGYHKTSTSASGLVVSTNTSSVFEDFFKDEFNKVWPDDLQYDRDVAYWCDSIANAHASDTLAVGALVVISKTGLLNNQETELWKKEFPINVQ